jgi:hypothetical protein
MPSLRCEPAAENVAFIFTGFVLAPRKYAKDAISENGVVLTPVRPAKKIGVEWRRLGQSSSRTRWLLSTNPKEMGSLYLLFAIHAGVDGTLFSMRVRIELALPFVSPVRRKRDIFYD